MKPSWVLFSLVAAVHLSGAAESENSIAFLGPKGSYSDQAASEYVSRADLAGATPLDTITQIALAVRNAQARYGVLPFENSIGGFVGETHRLLLAPQDPDWHVIADVTVSISDALTRLVETLHHVSFTLTNIDSVPTGKLGSYRFALIFDSECGADLEQIQARLRSTSASLIGAYRPSPPSR